MDQTVDGFVADVRACVGDVLKRVVSDPQTAAERAQQAVLEALWGDAERFCMAPDAKAVRPQVAGYVGLALAAPRAAMVDVAVAAELIHAGSLLQDDVMDGAAQRRGSPTLRASYGDRSAVLVGDLLMTVALQRLEPYAPVLIQEALAAIAAMSKSALVEIACRGRIDVARPLWRSIAAGKTGALFVFCSRAAAHVGGQPQALAALGEAGAHIGVAFQLGDDLLDLWPDGNGKEPFADLRNGECTFPVICAAQRSPSLRAAIEGLWREADDSQQEVLMIGKQVRSMAAADVVGQIAQEIDQARLALGAMAETAGGAALVAWTASLVRRAQGVIEDEVAHAAG